MNTWNNIFMLNNHSPNSLILMFLYDYIHLMTMIIILFVLYWIGYNFVIKLYSKKLNNNQIIELIWTTLPMLILIMIAIPSMKTLYLIDDNNIPHLTIKISGHQWYWTYDYNNMFSSFMNKSFDSFIVSNLNNSSFRLLETDTHMIIPIMTYIDLIVTSDDVIHAFTIPSLGMKIDAVPGRLNHMMIYSLTYGIFYGQCSEMCGVNHSFMPITIETSSMNYFLKWIYYF